MHLLNKNLLVSDGRHKMVGFSNGRNLFVLKMVFLLTAWKERQAKVSNFPHFYGDYHNNKNPRDSFESFRIMIK